LRRCCCCCCCLGWGWSSEVECRCYVAAGVAAASHPVIGAIVASEKGLCCGCFVRGLGWHERGGWRCLLLLLLELLGNAWRSWGISRPGCQPIVIVVEPTRRVLGWCCGRC